MILLGDQPIPAREAIQRGLLDRIVTDEMLQSEAEAICQAACEVERRHVVKMKQHLAAAVK